MKFLALVAAVSALQMPESATLVMLADNDEMKPLKGKPLKKVAKAPPAGLEHCPDFDERHTLVNGRVRGIPWPAKGFNCQNEGHH